ncbi:MAG: hypothetical protein ACRCVI_02440 [Mycoplasmoidaceae bacterium]
MTNEIINQAEIQTPAPIDPNLVKFYSFSKKMMIASIITSILLFIAAIFGTFILVAVIAQENTDPLLISSSTIIYTIVIIILAIIPGIINIVWAIKALIFKSNNEEINQILLIMGILCLVVIGWIGMLVSIIKIKRIYPNISSKTS